MEKKRYAFEVSTLDVGRVHKTLVYVDAIDSVSNNGQIILKSGVHLRLQNDTDYEKVVRILESTGTKLIPPEEASEKSAKKPSKKNK
jgi:hypothetical protein